MSYPRPANIFIYTIEVRHAFRPTVEPLDTLTVITQQDFEMMLSDTIASTGEYGLEGETHLVHNALLKVCRHNATWRIIDTTQVLQKVGNEELVKYYGVSASMSDVEISEDMYRGLLD